VSRAYVDLKFVAHWELINTAREFLLAFFQIALCDAAVAGAVSLAAHELMENAIKYSPDVEAHIEGEIDDDGRIRISIENRATAEAARQLVAEVEATNAAPDPLAWYRRKMEESLTRGDGKSGLGLARIRCEARMSIECAVTDEHVVRVTAVRTPD
jgi:hypothetical protein